MGARANAIEREREREERERDRSLRGRPFSKREELSFPAFVATVYLGDLLETRHFEASSVHVCACVCVCVYVRVCVSTYVDIQKWSVSAWMGA